LQIEVVEVLDDIVVVVESLKSISTEFHFTNSHLLKSGKHTVIFVLPTDLYTNT